MRWFLEVSYLPNALSTGHLLLDHFGRASLDFKKLPKSFCLGDRTQEHEHLQRTSEKSRARVGPEHLQLRLQLMGPSRLLVWWGAG